MKYLLLTILLFPTIVFAAPETYFLKLVNKERAKYDLAPLAVDEEHYKTALKELNG